MTLTRIIVVDNVLATILICQSNVDDETVINTIDRTFVDEDVHEARRKLYDALPEDDGSGQDLGAAAKRRFRKAHVQDLVSKLRKEGKNQEVVSFCMPWEFAGRIPEFKTDAETLADAIVDVRNKDLEDRLSSIEKKILDSNKSYH